MTQARALMGGKTRRTTAPGENRGTPFSALERIDPLNDLFANVRTRASRIPRARAHPSRISPARTRHVA